MSTSLVNTGSTAPSATPSCNRLSQRSGDETTAGDGAAAAGAAAGLLLAWQAALDHHLPVAVAGALLPTPSGTQVALHAALAAGGEPEGAPASSLAALQPAPAVQLQAEFRTAPGEHWQLELRRDAGPERLSLSLSAGFVPPVLATAQLPRLSQRLGQRGKAVDRLEWRHEGREREDAE